MTTERQMNLTSGCIVIVCKKPVKDESKADAALSETVFRPTRTNGSRIVEDILMDSEASKHDVYKSSLLDAIHTVKPIMVNIPNGI